MSPPAIREHLSFPQKQLLLPEIPQLSLGCRQVCQAPDLNPFSLVIFSLSSLCPHKFPFFPWLLLKARSPQGQACMSRAAFPLFHPRVFFQTSPLSSRCNSTFILFMYQISYIRDSLSVLNLLFKKSILFYFLISIHLAFTGFIMLKLSPHFIFLRANAVSKITLPIQEVKKLSLRQLQEITQRCHGNQ